MYLCFLPIDFRQERPCTRCIKRNIGHLCHDEPRESAKRPKGEPGHTTADDEMPVKLDDASGTRLGVLLEQQRADQQTIQNGNPDINSQNAAAQPSLPPSNAAISPQGPGP